MWGVMALRRSLAQAISLLAFTGTKSANTDAAVAVAVAAAVAAAAAAQHSLRAFF